MSFWNNVKSLFVTTEKDVVALIADVKKDAVVFMSDINKGIAWVVKATPTIAADLVEAEGLIKQSGVASPTVDKALVDANMAMAGLNAFAVAYNSGKNDGAALVSGFVALKSAQGAVAMAAAAAAAAPIPAA